VAAWSVLVDGFLDWMGGSEERGMAPCSCTTAPIHLISLSYRRCRPYHWLSPTQDNSKPRIIHALGTTTTRGAAVNEYIMKDIVLVRCVNLLMHYISFESFKAWRVLFGFVLPTRGISFTTWGSFHVQTVKFKPYKCRGFYSSCG
jgi:hypothetical protein